MTALLIGPAVTVTVTVQQRTRTAPPGHLSRPDARRPPHRLPPGRPVRRDQRCEEPDRDPGPRGSATRPPRSTTSLRPARTSPSAYRAPVSPAGWPASPTSSPVSRPASGPVERRPRRRQRAHPPDQRVQAAARPPLDPRRPLRPARSPLHGDRPRPVRPRHRDRAERRAGAVPGRVTARNGATGIPARPCGPTDRNPPRYRPPTGSAPATARGRGGRRAGGATNRWTPVRPRLVRDRWDFIPVAKRSTGEGPELRLTATGEATRTATGAGPLRW